MMVDNGGIVSEQLTEQTYRLLILAQGSDKDTSFEQTKVDGKTFQQYFEELNADGNEAYALQNTLVASCHGNIFHLLEHLGKIKKYADAGHKIAIVDQGGLSFAKPGINAAYLQTVPVISVPLEGGDFDGASGILAADVPPGAAAFGVVGVENHTAAANFARAILTKDFDKVYVYSDGTDKSKEKNDKIADNLKKLGVVYHEITDETLDLAQDGLVIGAVKPLELQGFDKIGSANIFVPNFYENDSPGEKLDALMFNLINLERTVYVNREENAARFAATIIAMNDRTVYIKLQETAAKKAGSYATRQLALSEFGIN